MEYKKLIEMIHQCDVLNGDAFLLNNHNGELVNSHQENLLDSAIFSVEFVHEINKKLLDIPGFKSDCDSITLGRIQLVNRLDRLSQYYMKTQREQDAEMIDSLAETVFDVDAAEVTVSRSPNIFVVNKKLHPNIVRRLPVRRVLFGFTIFRRIQTQEILNELECACAH